MEKPSDQIKIQQVWLILQDNIVLIYQQCVPFTTTNVIIIIIIVSDVYLGSEHGHIAHGKIILNLGNIKEIAPHFAIIMIISPMIPKSALERYW